ncbi:MAG: phosphomannomutase/phosphoglucomutase [Cyanobacteria bacterium P01_G01_bin.4]
MLKLKKKKAAASAGPQSAGANHPQGIVASGNALYKIAALALAIVLGVMLASFAYLILLREPSLQKTQLDRVSSAFATQQATNVHQLLDRIKQRMAGAAGSPLAMSAIASESREDLDLIEQAMLDYFPEVISLRVLPMGEMGTADFAGGNEGLRNHIEIDLVRRAGIGEPTQPESYQFEDRWLTSLAARVTHPRINDQQAVVLATFDNQLLTEALSIIDTSAGRFSLQQVYLSPTGRERIDTIATAGSGDADAFAQTTKLPEGNWAVTFTPSQTLVQAMTLNPMPLFWVLGLCVVAAIAGVLLMVMRFSKTLDTQINKVIAAADVKSPLELNLPGLVTIAKQLRRATLRTLRQSGSSQSEPPQPGVEVLPGQSGELTNPMFQHGMIVEEGDDLTDLDLGLGSQTGDGLAAAEPGFPSHIFRAYDIRGHAQNELTDDLVARIGKAIGTLAEEMQEQTIVVGCDGRKSSPRIKSTLIKALMESGRDVIDIGLVPTPLVYFATRHLNCRSGVMVTGSHNPGQDNGLKIVLNQQTIAAGGIQRILEIVLQDEYSSGNGRMIREDVTSDYIDEIITDIAIAVPIKVVIDAGNGATGVIAPQLFSDLGCEVIPLHCEIDGNFPNHPPDTGDEDNLEDLIEAVQSEGADFGVAFDGDGDRLAVVTSSGHIVRSDVLLMIFAKDVVSRNPGADVVFDVKCSRNLTQLITRFGGRPVLWKTGHAFMKEKMAETGALLGGEFSGHIFFGERWYSFDDGMYAAARLAEILSAHGDSLDASIEEFPATVNTPEIIIPVAEQEKFDLMDRIIRSSDFSTGKINTIDGIRVDFADGWGLVRASNTSPALTARFEADSQDALEAIKTEFRAQIALVESKLELNF